MTTNDPMTPAALAEIAARAEAATAGPWEWEAHDESMVSLGQPNHCISADADSVLSSWRCKSCIKSGNICHWPSKEDGDFIAHARTDIPRLLAEVARLEAENAWLRTPNMFWVEHTEEMCNENAEDCAVEYAEQVESDGDELPTLVTLLCAHSLPRRTYAISRDEKGRVHAAQSLTTPKEPTNGV